MTKAEIRALCERTTVEVVKALASNHHLRVRLMDPELHCLLTDMLDKHPANRDRSERNLLILAVRKAVTGP